MHKSKSLISALGPDTDSLNKMLFKLSIKFYHTDIRQIAIFLSIIQSIAYHKFIRNLKAGADVSHLKLIVICFDFQAELLKRYFGDLATIRTIDARKTAELFKIPYGGGAS